MKTLEELLLEDFVILFFGRPLKLDDEYYRKYVLKLNNYMDAFPKNEVTRPHLYLKNGNIVATTNNYIKD